MAPNAMILVFWMLSFKPAFSLSSLTFIQRLNLDEKQLIVWNKSAHNAGDPGSIPG